MSGFSDSTFAAPANFVAKGLGSIDPYCHIESTATRMITKIALGPDLETGGEELALSSLDWPFPDIILDPEPNLQRVRQKHTTTEDRLTLIPLPVLGRLHCTLSPNDAGTKVKVRSDF